MSVRCPFSTTYTWCATAKLRATSSRLACTSSVDIPTSRAISPGMRRDDDVAAFAAGQPIGIAGERVQPVGVDHQRHRRAIDELRGRTRACPAPGRGPGRSRRRRAPMSSTRSTPSGSRPSAVSSSASVMYSGAIAATIGLAAGRRRDGDQAGARPQRADRREMRRAGLAARAGDDQHAAVVALVAVRRPRRDQLAHRRRASAARRAGRRAARCTSPGMPMSAITMSPARVSAGRQHQRQLRRGQRHGQARLDRRSPIGSGESADSPDGRSIDTTGMPDALTSATTVSMQAATAAR